MEVFTSGQELKAARALAGVTQAQIARESGIHQNTMQYWEKRKNTSGMHPRLRLAVSRSFARRGVYFIGQDRIGVYLGPRYER